MRFQKSSAILLFPFILFWFHAGCDESDFTKPPFTPPKSFDVVKKTDLPNRSAQTKVDDPPLEVILNLPFSSSSTYACPQKMSVETKHNRANTKHDLDFELPKTDQVEIYSPVSGVLYTHPYTQDDPFGLHVTIDRDDETYVIIGKLDEIFAPEGEYVAEGQLIARAVAKNFNRVTHVCIGVHIGNPKLPAQNGISIPGTYMVMDPNNPYEKLFLTSDMFACNNSVDMYGESPQYVSTLPTALWHPNGAVVKTKDDEKTYLVSNGKLREIMNEEILESYGYHSDHVAIISQEEFDCYSHDQPIDEQSFVDAVMDPNGTIWLINGSKKQWNRYRIEVPLDAWEYILDSWGLPYTEWNPPPLVEETDLFLTQWTIKKGFSHFRTGSLVKELSDSPIYIIVDGVAVQFRYWDTFLMLGYQWQNIIKIETGMVKTIQKKVGDCEQNDHCLDLSVITMCGGGQL